MPRRPALPPRRAALALLGSLPWTSCAGSAEPAGGGAHPVVPVVEARGYWATETASPRPAAAMTGMLGDLVGMCARPDAGLHRVAALLARSQANGQGMLDTEHVTHELRAAGVPQVWPRAWAMVGNPTPEEAKEGLSGWLASFSEGGERRCGIGAAQLADGREVISVIAVDALADLDPIPVRARLGQWVTIRATLLEAAQEAEVVVLGPRGVPRTIPTTLHGAEIRASFAADYAGAWKVQVLPTFPSGPRPVLEAMLFVDQAPPDAFQALTVPGEDGARQGDDPASQLYAMLGRARELEGLPKLERLEALEVAASIHAKAMMESLTLAHDVGVGNPAVRLQALGLAPSLAGENVARAVSVTRSHRALWDSPSHRSNLLHPGFTHVGIGVAEDANGSFWVCEVFAAF